MEEQERRGSGNEREEKQKIRRMHGKHFPPSYQNFVHLVCGTSCRILDESRIIMLLVKYTCCHEDQNELRAADTCAQQ
jgi:hypothetical protein